MLRYLFFKFISGLGYALTIVLFYPNKDILNLIYLILVQEFIFSFFLTYYKVNVIAKKKRIPDLQIKILSYFGLIIIAFCIPQENYSYGVFISINMLLFPYYLIEATDYESYSFQKAIKLENTIAPISVGSFFIISLILFFSGLDWSGLIFIRFFIFYSLYILIIKKKKKKLEFVISKYLETKESIININILLIITFFIFKLILMNKGITQTDKLGLEGKLYLFVYDLIAAIYGFSLRYFVFKKILGREKFKMILIYYFIASLLISLIFIILPIDSITKLTIFMSFTIAAGYGLFCLIPNYKYILIGVLITIFSCYLVIFSSLILSALVLSLGYLILFFIFFRINKFNNNVV